MSATEVQALLRFLSQDAKVPLGLAMSKVKDLQAANLDSPEKLAKVKAKDVVSMFPDEKVAKQIVAAAKRVSKKRAAGEEATSSPRKKRKESLFSQDTVHTNPADLEHSVALPTVSVTDGELDLEGTTLYTNRAPLVLAFVVTLLKYTMPEQPLSSRLSLAQGYVSTTSRSRAVSLGIEYISKEEQAQEAALGEGQPLVTIMGKDLRVLRRWGYEADPELSTQGTLKQEDQLDEVKPALWALDLEALRKSNSTAPALANAHGNLPIYTPQSARAYLLKSFDTPPAAADVGTKKISAAARKAEKERNLGNLLRSIELLYDSWAETLSPEELEKRTWGWYVKVRPDVENGVAGWGGKNEVKLGAILALRRSS
ncbi:hypothetical protein LTR36_000731 [Oleoguttula mirabilis]|uniref:Uncharacterized protein n=1 Tax=Oleoguttula mirabilis TaxID=1507867 RepID=A0AAV9JQS2_9PEZI|nr:hypothetical protein LTR36_000731 [Oleoguttula mirabilis]